MRRWFDRLLAGVRLRYRKQRARFEETKPMPKVEEEPEPLPVRYECREDGMSAWRGSIGGTTRKARK